MKVDERITDLDTDEQSQNALQTSQNEQQRVENFLQVLEDASRRFGVNLGISDTITRLPNGGFIYTPPTIIPVLIKDWTPEAK